ncbi:hypothetical protein GAO09_22595 [Rhizobiales bacterium RZME27]|uniref:Uncharacterized protein n=1 Tax=Endobacterium cereale TaxID=2663029 RepID=A0A6A8AG93_9HYPH|nr:hypothetical protein [Endobacterium cereale]MEB2845545.1 hypothetical protein [Endobacterium cereale]MQY48827.1 hypothetical protein [Endobacterium cereale]
MKGIKIRLSRKLALILGGIVVFGGGSGAAALYVSHAGLLGSSSASLNGLTCSTVQTVKIKRDHQYWVRKYVVADTGDGPARVRTAVRVAKAVQESEKADLVQIAILDKAGPTDRAAMRGRAIGAQVIYTPDPAKVPDGVMNHPLAAFYLDGTADATGQYYGMRVDLPYEDIDGMAASLTDFEDCIEPIVATPEGGHGGAGKAKGSEGGHGGGEAAGHGEKPAAEGHDAAPAEAHDAPAADAHGTPDGGEVVASTPQEKGFLSSITGMFFGDKTEEAPAIDAGTTAAAGDHPAEDTGHEAKAAEPKVTEPAGH